MTTPRLPENRKVHPDAERFMRRACFYSGLLMLNEQHVRYCKQIEDGSGEKKFAKQVRRCEEKRNESLDGLRRFIGERIGYVDG